MTNRQPINFPAASMKILDLLNTLNLPYGDDLPTVTDDFTPGSLFYLTTDDTIYQLTTGGTWIPVAGSGFGGNQLLSGGDVTWVSGLTFDVQAATYRINGVVYSSPGAQITLAAADPSNPRYDLIILTTASVADDITGTPAASPVQPVPDPATQLGLAYIHIAAGATTPTGVSIVTVYDENVEWTASSDMTGFNSAYAVNPFSGLLSTRVTNNTGSKYIKYLNSSVVLASSYQTLKFYVRLPSAWSASVPLTVGFYNGSTAVSSAVNFNNTVYGFVRTTVNSYQVISIPISAFTFSNNAFDNIQFRTTQSHGGFQIDLIQLQSGVVIISSTGVTSFNGRTGAVVPQVGDYIVESATVAALPAVGQTGKIYVITTGGDINKTYRWTGSAYALIGDGAGGGGTWGSITGTLSSQTDLQTALDGKVDENTPITPATKTKITYDADGLVTAGADATTADINDSSNRRYVTDAQLGVIGNTSGTNTGDQTLPVKATAAELNTGTDDAKFATALGLENSKYVNQNDTKNYATASGTDTYTASMTPALTAYVAGQRFNIKFTNANTTSSTININSLGAKNIFKGGSSSLSLGDIVANQVLAIVYDGTQFQIVGGSSSGGSSSSGGVGDKLFLYYNFK